MKNTWLKLTKIKCDKLIEALDNIPMSKRDPTYNQLLLEIKQINDIWSHINVKAIHRSKVKNTIKVNNKRIE